MSEKLRLIAEIVKPQGIKGGLKCRVFTDNATLFKKLQKVIVGGVEKKILRAEAGGSFVFLYLEGITDRNVAEEFRGKEIYATKEDSAILKEGSFFIEDVIGVKAFLDGKVIGTVIDVFQYSPSADVFELETADKRRINFPFVKGVVENIDVEKGEMTLNFERFSEVAIFENEDDD